MAPVSHLNPYKNLTVFILLAAILLAACQPPAPVPSTPENTAASPEATPSQTTVQPTATPTIPLAARVNGEGISLAQVQAELERYRQAVGTELAPEQEQQVLDELIDRLLLAQGAAEAGHTVDDAAVQARIDELSQQLGSPTALSEWMAAQGYDEAGFREDLAQSMAAAWMRDQVAAGVPEAVEQVHARQILHYNSDAAAQALADLQAGADFEALASEADPLTHGDLGWFPRGYLLDLKLEEAAFALQPGEHSGIIETAAGFHILEVVERDPQRPLDPNSRRAVQAKAVEDWLADRRSQSEIEILDQPL